MEADDEDVDRSQVLVGRNNKREEKSVSGRMVEVVLPQTVPIPGVGTPHCRVEVLGPLSVSPSLPWLSISLLPAMLPGRQLFVLLESSKKFQS